MSLAMWVVACWAACSLIAAIGNAWEILDSGQMTVFDLLVAAVSIALGPVSLVVVAVMMVRYAGNRVLWQSRKQKGQSE